ncbi:MAG: hypothetical protein NQU48_01470 [Hadesarchaea archaeon]|jgi:hypothetical protein|nr:hypothetical protein [Hadesarchaea archaeon]TDA30775.1 MAG: hypothetical protein DSO04_05385 [Hadesarchaea archaeon]
MEPKDYLEMVRGFYKMGFSVARTTLDMMKVAMDSYVNLYELYMRPLLPAEVYESMKKTLEAYLESQGRVFENFKKLLDSFERQQDEVFSKFLEMTKTQKTQ